MKITCPACNTVYNIPSHKIPEGKQVSTKCKKCGGRIVVEARVDETKPTILMKEPAFIKETKSEPKKIGAIRKQKIVEKESKKTESNEKKIKKPKPKICGFWRRLFAFIIDVSMLGIVGIALGAMFYDFLAELGGWGRLLGFAVAFLYFGLLNSSIGNGQTLGKRILKIQVVDKGTKTIAISKSFLRFMILGIPYFLNDALIPPDILINTFISLVLGLIVFFGCGAIVYLFVFNRETRQSLHDLIIGTYVVNISSDEELFVKPIWKGHWAAVSALFVTVIVLIVFVVPKFANKEPFSDLLLVQKNIQKSSLVYVATVTVGKSSGTDLSADGGGKWESTHLAINAVLRHRPSDYDSVATQIASIIFETYPKVMEKDSLVITASYGYDIGIARAWKSHSFKHSPNEWQKILGDAKFKI